ncbi:hybrid sensor histidine kinase/response regulator [Alkalicaulis satelles]|nr:PAS domain-containing sensor histidine kinase [Alkalicaulis satelles]
MTDATPAETGQTADDAPAAAAPAAAPAPASGPGSLTRPLARIILWTASLGALIAAGVAVIAGAAAGWHGVVLLCGIAAAALLVLYALAAGEAAGRALRGNEPSPPSLAEAALEAAPDPMLISARTGRTLWANAAYRDLAKASGLSAGFGAPGPERLFSGESAAGVYRLARAGARGEPGCETLTVVQPGVEGAAFYACDVSPMSTGAVLWRFSRVQGDDSLDPPAPPEWAEYAPVGLCLADGEGRVLAANATLRDWLGVAADKALRIRDILAPDSARAFLKSQGAKTVISIAARLKGRGGVDVPVGLSVEWADAAPACARVVVHDSASVLVAHHGEGQVPALSPSSAGRTLDDMFATAPFGVARLDGEDPQDAVIEDANPALVQLSGGQALPGRRFADLFRFTDGETPAMVFARALAGRGDPSEARLACGEGEKAVQVFLAPAREGQRSAYVMDVSGWKELEQQIDQAGKMQAIGQLASGVAHDFNNMLTVVKFHLGELLARHPVGDPDYQDLQQIRSVSARQAGLVRKLLAFSRKQTFRMTVFDLSDVLSDCSHMLNQILEESVRLEIRHGRDLPLVRADRVQIDNILVNLATNARDAMKAQGGGVLTITTESVDADAVRKAGAPDPAEGPWAAIHVSDTGCGMDEATRAKIFEPFFTTRAAEGGSGLGLSTVYGIIKQSGGFLFVDSRPGKGATFHIYLPGHTPSEDEVEEIAAERAAAEIKPEPRDQAGHGRILFVEDEEMVRTVAAKTLRRKGYEVIEACDGEEALEILEAEPESFDLLLSDVVMPGLSGPKMLEQARHLLGEARIVFISGYAEEEFSDTLSSDLEISFLPKPFEIQDLAERVKQELALGRARAETGAS